MTASQIQNKHIVITGGASGIGAETARLLTTRKAKVFFGDRNEQAGQDLLGEIQANGGQAKFVSLDVTSSDSVAGFFKQAIDSFGNIDVAVNNAGIDQRPSPFVDVSKDEYDRILAVNLTGVWSCMKQELKHMLRSGHGNIINMASTAGIAGSALISAYAASKYGVIGLTKAAAIEYANANIRVNAVCPSVVRTPMLEGRLEKTSERYRAALRPRNPMGRFGEPSEIAAAVAWLCSDESSFMTGQTLVLDGGLTAGIPPLRTSE